MMLQLTLDSRGWCQQAQHTPSPNFDARPPGTNVDLLVIHNISLPPRNFGGKFISDFFCNKLDYEADPYFYQLRDLRVSAHFLISRNGELVQFVSIHDRAWHAGQSFHLGRERCNDFSIGIELEGTDDLPFTNNQYKMLAQLTSTLCQHTPLKAVTGHSHIAPQRKTDPGPCFKWAHYQSMLSPTAISELHFP